MSEEMTDQAIRAITNDGAFRVVAIRVTDMVRGAIAAQQVSKGNAEVFAELMTGAVLVRETMSPGNRVQIILKPSGTTTGLTMIADSRPEGLTRGLVNNDDFSEARMKLGSGTILQVMRALYNGELQQGIVETTGERGISGALTDYMLTSEQITSVIEVAARLGEDGEIEHAAGFIVQLLPEVTPEVLAPMTERLEDRPALEKVLSDRGADPTQMIANLLEGFEHTLLGEEEVFWGCTCSEVRLVGAMSTLSEEELRDIVEHDQSLDVTCEYCNTDYQLSSEQLRPLLDTN